MKLLDSWIDRCPCLGWHRRTCKSFDWWGRWRVISSILSQILFASIWSTSMANARKYTVHWVFGYACIVRRSYFCVFCLMFVFIFWMSFMLELHVMALHLFDASRDFPVSLLCFFVLISISSILLPFFPVAIRLFWRSLVGHGRPRGLGRTHSKGRYLDCHGWLLGD